MSFTDKRFCVYVHRRPDNNEVFYVGQGTAKRPYSKTGRSSVWLELVRNLGTFNVEIVSFNLTKDQAIQLESELITKYTSAINRKRDSSTVKDIPLDELRIKFQIDEKSKSGLSYRVDVLSGKYFKSLIKTKGDSVGSISKSGYWQMQHKGKCYAVHRVIYALYHGSIDKNLVIDHIDGNRLNNNISNLRQVSVLDNNIKARTRKDSSSGIKGIGWNEKYQFYRATTCTSDGLTISKCFKAKESKELALSLAVDWLKEQIKLKETGLLGDKIRALKLNKK